MINKQGREGEELASSARNVQYWSFIFSIFSLCGKIWKWIANEESLTLKQKT